jgi:hypothetical protein
MKVITTYFRDARSAKLVRTGSAEVVTLDRGAATTRVAWARGATDADITLPAFAAAGLLVALDGSTQPIQAVNGQYKITLPAARCDDPNYGCRVSGHPIVLVEGEAADPAAATTIQVSTATPLPGITTTSPAEAATNASAMPAPTETATATPMSRPSDTPAPAATSQPTTTFTPTPIVIAQKNPMPTLMPARALPSAVGGGLPTGLIVLGVAVAIVAGVMVLYRPRKKK